MSSSSGPYQNITTGSQITTTAGTSGTSPLIVSTPGTYTGNIPYGITGTSSNPIGQWYSSVVRFEYKVFMGEFSLEIHRFDILTTSKKNQIILVTSNTHEFKTKVMTKKDVIKETTKLHLFDTDNKYLFTLIGIKFTRLLTNDADLKVVFTYDQVIEDIKTKQMYEMTLKGK